MKREIANDIAYALTPKDVTALAAAIINHNDAGTAGRATYLRSLLAGVQVELIGKPVLRHLRSDHRRVTQETSLTALEKVNAIYYEAVLAAVPEGLAPLERQAKTSFARSSASTLRRAIALGWDVLTPVGEAAKVTLSQWVREHGVTRAMTPARAEKAVMKRVAAIADLLAQIPKADAERVLSTALADLGVVDPAPVQRMRSVSLRRHPPERPAAH